MPLVDLADGDVVVVTSKVVSKAEGRVRRGTREEALPGETVRVVARRGETAIVRTRHGLTLAAAGIDGSNVEAGSVVLLPEDPDASARGIRERAALPHRPQRRRRRHRHRRPGLARGPDRHRDRRRRTAGRRELRRAHRRVRQRARGHRPGRRRRDRRRRRAGPGQARRPPVRCRPRPRRPGAARRARTVRAPRALVRADGADLFGYGAREAVVRALRGDPADRLPFGAPRQPDRARRGDHDRAGPDPVTLRTGRLRAAR